jgi:hypothetical protein
MVTVLFTVIFLNIHTSVAAHEIEGEGSVKALLHIDPSDSPVAGDVSTLSLQFTDKEERFNLKECDCVLSIQHSGKTIFTKQLSDDPRPSIFNTDFDYTFPERGEYVVTVAGEPKKEDAFDEFSLTYNVKVDKGVFQMKYKTVDYTVFYVCAAVLIMASILGIVIYLYTRSVPPRQKHPRR